MVAGSRVIADLAGRNVLEPMTTVSLKCRPRVASSEICFLAIFGELFISIS